MVAVGLWYGQAYVMDNEHSSQLCFLIHLKKCEYHGKGQYFLSLISESETHILYRFITHGVKYFKPLFLEMLMIMPYR